jgi:hypothetical protein
LGVNEKMHGANSGSFNIASAASPPRNAVVSGGAEDRVQWPIEYSMSYDVLEGTPPGFGSKLETERVDP